MKKLVTITLIIGAAGILFYFFQKTNGSKTETSQADIYDLNSQKINKENLGTDVIPTQNDGIMKNDQDSAEMMKSEDTPENSINYSITQDSTAGYIAQKRFFNKPDAEVIGTASSINGSGWYDNETGDFYLSADIDLTKLASDSSGRDKDILAFFTPKTANIMFGQNDTEDKIKMGESFSTTLNANLTINGVTKTIPFEIEGTLMKDSFTATGSASVKMSEFNINPPSLLNVYTVDDMIELTFDVTGLAQN